MATVWITVLAIGVLLLQSCSAQVVYQSCNPVNRLFKFPDNCHKFLSCAPMGLIEMDCPANLAFDEYNQRCDYSIFVPGCEDSVPRSPCSPKPCVNGTCSLSSSNSRGYECLCNQGFTGPSCANDIDECSSLPRPCEHGICTNTPGSFNCDCGNSGYTGRFCQIPPAEKPCIDGQPCVNGRCQPGTNSNFCVCSTGFEGRLCDSSVTGPCQSSPCANGGRCNLGQNGGYTCNCTGTGYGGATCTTNHCIPKPCKNGRCIGSSSGFNCDCRGSGYEGVFCDIPVTENSTCVTGNPCVRGVCVMLGSGLFCNCQGTGYTGTTCSQQVFDNACFPGACPNGVCVSSGMSYTCNCTGTVYTGPRCDMTACDFQSYNPCMNGATCIPHQRETYTCACPNGFTGGNCETLIIPPGCPTHQCPSSVPRYNYPDWADRSCRSYYNCEFGILEQQLCPLGQQFDVISMVCKDISFPSAVFCDAFRK